MDKIIPECIDKSLTSALQPIGKTFGDLWDGIIGHRIHYWSQSVKIKSKQHLLETINEKISKIPPEKRLPLDIQILGNTLEDSTYCLDKDEIMDMFANLMASSLDSDKEPKVHPSFSSIIKKMTPRDASNFSLFKSNSAYAIAKFLLCPYGDKKIGITEKSDIFDANPNYQDFDKQAISINALQSLGLIEISYHQIITGVDYKSKFSSLPVYRELQENLKNVLPAPNWYKLLLDDLGQNFEKATKATRSLYDHQTTIEIQGGTVEVTNLGKAFIDVCL